MRWESLREEEFDHAIEVSNKVCVVPIGCLEMHGEHLPVGTDTYIVDYVCNEAAKKEEVCVFPPITYGNVPFLTKSKGAIRLTVELMQQFLTELCAEIARNGFKKILIVNGHGGNPPLLQNFVSSTQHTKKDYVVMCRQSYVSDIYSLAEELRSGKEYPELTPEDIAVIYDFVDKKKEDGHAGMEETTKMLAVAPELVELSSMYHADGVSTGRSAYLKDTGILNASARFWVVEHPDQYGGHHPEGASDRIGQVLIRKDIEAQAETVRLLKMDDRILEWNEEWNQSW